MKFNLCDCFRCLPFHQTLAVLSTPCLLPALPDDLFGRKCHRTSLTRLRGRQDDANSRGGKWIVRLRKGLASRCWENLVLALLGAQFMVGEEICGAVVSVRHMEDIISVWNRTAADTTTTGRIRDTLKRVLNLPHNTIMEYKTHTDSLR